MQPGLVDVVALSMPALIAGGVLISFGALLAAVTIRYAREELFHPLVCFNAVLVYFVLVPATGILVLGRFSQRYPLEDAVPLVGTALTILLGAYLLSLLGYHALGRFLATRNRRGHSSVIGTDRLTNSRGIHHTIDRRVLRWIGAAGLLAGAVFYLYYVLVNGGFGRLLTITPRTAFQTVPNTGRWRFLALMGTIGGFVTICAGLHHRVVDNTLRTRDWALALGALVVVLGIVFSFRVRMPIAAIGLFVLVYAYSADVASDRTFVGAGFGVVLIGGSFTFVEFALMGTIETSALVRGFVQFARFDVFLAVVHHVPANHPYQFGSTIIGAIPVEWPSAPLAYGEQLDRMIGGNRSGITISAMLPGELWLNFGPVGLAIGSFVYGTGLRGIYVLRRSHHPFATLLYPALVVVVILLWPTNVLWATKVLIFDFAVPVCLAGIAALAITRYRNDPAPT